METIKTKPPLPSKSGGERPKTHFDLQIYVDDLMSMIIRVTSKSPKKFRYSYSRVLQELVMEIDKGIYLANDIRDPEFASKREQIQFETGSKLKYLAYLCDRAELDGVMSFTDEKEIASLLKTIEKLFNSWSLYKISLGKGK